MVELLVEKLGPHSQAFFVEFLKPRCSITTVIDIASGAMDCLRAKDRFQAIHAASGVFGDTLIVVYQLLQSLSLWRAVIDRLEKPGTQILDEIESIQPVTLVVALFGMIQARVADDQLRD